MDQTHRDELRSFLNSIAEAKTEIALCQDRIQKLNEASQSITTAWKDTPGGGGDVHKDGSLTSLADEITKYTTAVAIWHGRRLAAIRFIDQLEDAVYRVILTLRYVDCLPWSKIPDAMTEYGLYYAERQIYRLHGEALNAARKIFYREEPVNEDCDSEKKDK